MAENSSSQQLLNKKANAYKNTFVGEFGVEVLADILYLKDAVVFNENPLKMARAAALHDFAVHVERLIKIGRGELAIKKRNVNTEIEPQYDPDDLVIPRED